MPLKILNYSTAILGNLDSYSSTILRNVFRLVLLILRYLNAVESNTTFDWLNHMVNTDTVS